MLESADPRSRAGAEALASGQLQVGGHGSHLELNFCPTATGGQVEALRTRVSTFTGVGNY